jgi:hypothetical protein
MIVLGCIKIHLNSCIRKIIVKELWVLLILHFQMQRILVKAKLNIYVWSVKTKAPLIKCYDDASSKKHSLENTCVGLHTEHPMFLTKSC